MRNELFIQVIRVELNAVSESESPILLWPWESGEYPFFMGLEE